jgi:hypothetical protein
VWEKAEQEEYQSEVSERVVIIVEVSELIVTREEVSE